jgi:hypothetical protein
MIRSELHETIVGSPPEGWSLGHVTIDLKNPDERVAVEAFRRGVFAIHQVWSGRWRLSHAPTGLQIWTTDTLGKTAELADRILPLADWGAIEKMEPSGSPLYPKVRAVIDEPQFAG